MERRREKLLNAILYFAQNTKMFGVTKMMKLLFFYEFEFFKNAGFPPIGLEYFAYPKGPLPFEFWISVKDPALPLPRDIANILTRVTVNYSEEACGSIFKPKQEAEVNFEVFSKLEKKIIQDLAIKYKFTSAKDMSEISHEDGLPWSKTIENKGNYERIEYLYALGKKSLIDPHYAREATEQYTVVNDMLGNSALDTTNDIVW